MIKHILNVSFVVLFGFFIISCASESTAPIGETPLDPADILPDENPDPAEPENPDEEDVDPETPDETPPTDETPDDNEGTVGPDDDVVVVVPEPEEKSPVIKLSVNDNCIPEGESALIQWQVTNATSVYFEGKKVGLKGSQKVTPKKLRKYTLVAVNGSKEIKESIQVGIIQSDVDFGLSEKKKVSKPVQALSLAEDGNYLAMSDGVIYSGSYNKELKALNPNNYVAGWAAMAVDPTHSDIMYAATDGRVYRSTDGGKSWPDVIPVRRNNADLAINTIYVSPIKSHLLYIGASGGGFVLDTKAKKLDLMTSLNTHEVLMFAAGGTELFVKTDSGLKLSTDDGSHWTNFDVPEDLGEVTHIAFDAEATWFGGSDSLYKRSGGNWERMDLVEGAILDLSVVSGKVLVLSANGVYGNLEEGSWTQYADEMLALWVIKAPDLKNALFLGENAYYSINKSNMSTRECPLQDTIINYYPGIIKPEHVNFDIIKNIDWSKINSLYRD